VDQDSFGARYAHIDDSLDTSLLDFLDRVSEISAVRDAKRAATAALEPRAGQRVFEIGCGTGVDLPDLARSVKPGGKVFGVDSSAQALEAARPRVAAFPEIELVQARVERLPFEDGAFDACRADRTLQHVSEPEQALKELRRVLRRGGRLVVLEMKSALHGVESDGIIERAINERMWSAGARPGWLPLLLPLFLARTGFETVEFHPTQAESPRLEDADAALRLRASVGEAITAGTLERTLAEAWIAELERAAEQGHLVLRMDFVRITAVAS